MATPGLGTYPEVNSRCLRALAGFSNGDASSRDSLIYMLPLQAAAVANITAQVLEFVIVLKATVVRSLARALNFRRIANTTPWKAR